MDKNIKITEINMMGMPLIRWEYKSCVAEFGVNEEEKWATLYYVTSTKPGNGHATMILKTAKSFYEKQGKKFGGSVALNSRMSSLYRYLGIHEYCEID